MNESRLQFPKYIGYIADCQPEKVAQLVGATGNVNTDMLKVAFSQYMRASDENFINGIKIHPDYEIIQQVATATADQPNNANNATEPILQTVEVSKTNEILQKFIPEENIAFVKGAILVVLAVIFIKYITRD